MPGLMARVLDDDARTWAPIWRCARDRALAAGDDDEALAPYRSREEMQRSVAMTRAFSRDRSLARAKQAVSLVLVPQLGPETAAESALRHRVLDGSGLAYVVVPLDARWHIPGNKHRTRAARLWRQLVADRLQRPAASASRVEVTSKSDRRRRRPYRSRSQRGILENASFHPKRTSKSLTKGAGAQFGV